MNSKQRKILEAIFREPVSGSIEWSAIESLLVAVGCEIIEGNGSRVRFVFEGQVRDAREFLSQIGVKP
jgi:hypothetical protein